ncbi:MAG: shikimate dehydrogenase family protein [Rhodomicrobiaceae bacterium]
MAGRILKAGLIGEHIGRSRFAAAQALLCGEAGLTLDFTNFDTVEMTAFDFEDHVAGLPGQGFDGVTVTHPFKTRAHRLAGKINYPGSLGASNLLRFEPDGCQGFNTDYTGFKSVWAAQFGDAAPGRVAMAGAGGVSRALVAGLLDLGAERIDLWDLNPQLCRDVARVTDPSGKRVFAIEAVDEIPEAVRTANGLLNATPMGMDHYPGTAFDAALVGGQDWAFDAVYAPIDTVFLIDARAAGLTTITGFDLFRHMAVLSFEVYTGCLIDKPTAVEALRPLARGL